MSKVKKLFTIDDFMIAFVSALAYGFGERIPALFGCPELLCVVICFAVGIAVEEIVSKIVFSEAVQSKPSRRIAVYVAFIVAFLIGNYVSLTWMGESMVDGLLEETAFVVGLPVIGFVVALLIRAYRIRKVRERYGDGSEGYVTGMSDEDVEELNGRNQPVLGEHDAESLRVQRQPEGSIRHGRRAEDPDEGPAKGDAGHDDGRARALGVGSPARGGAEDLADRGMSCIRRACASGVRHRRGHNDVNHRGLPPQLRRLRGLARGRRCRGRPHRPRMSGF